jgi:two-component system, OmpR family, phosphate regulon response regulator PhoB
MKRVSIYTTDPEAAGFEPFTHDGRTFAFRLLAPGEPLGLVDGPLWLFVDWVLPDLSGLEMCRRLRADQRLRDAHVTMVLDEDDPEDRRRAIRAGADDYLIGPLTRQAMLDRVLALAADDIRAPAPLTLELGDLAINVGGEQARWQGQLIALRPNEFRVLRFLAENRNRVLTRQELVSALGKAGDPEYLRTVDVWIKRLRFGLRQAGAGHLLRTVHGRGYVLDLA